jgi:hypothetical protein
MRIKISYSSGGVPAPEIQETVGSFPVSYWHIPSFSLYKLVLV